jgi:hypothetical protein
LLTESECVRGHDDFDVPADPSMVHALPLQRFDVRIVEIGFDAKRAELTAHFHCLLLRVAVH